MRQLTRLSDDICTIFEGISSIYVSILLRQVNALFDTSKFMANICGNFALVENIDYFLGCILINTIIGVLIKLRKNYGASFNC